MTRVLHVTTTDESLELLLGPQLRAFSAAGYDVHTSSAPGPMTAELTAAGITHHNLMRSTRSMNLMSDLAAAREFAALLRRLRPDIVHTHNPKPGIYGRIISRCAGVPAVVNTVHGLYTTSTDPLLKRGVVLGLERLAASFSHLELVQNSEDLEVLAQLKIPRSKLILLENGIDLSRFHPDDEDRRRVRAELGVDEEQFVVLSVGRMVEEKGFLDLISAAKSLKETRQELTFLFVGGLDTEKSDHISSSQIDALMSEINGRWLGRRNDVPSLYRAADAFVLASHREGFPRAAMEASATGIPVVATDIRGCRQVVDDGRTGLLVAAHDPAGLAAGIEQLLTNPDRRRSMGVAGRTKALADFDDHRVIERTLSAYRRVVPEVSEGA